MYKKFYHSKRRYILWAMLVVLAQAVLFYAYPDLITIPERMILGIENPLPVFTPLYFAIIYGIISRHWIMSTLTGLLSWWCAPVILIVLGQYHQVRNIMLAVIADGIIYAIIGFLAAQISNLITRRKVSKF